MVAAGTVRKPGLMRKVLILAFATLSVLLLAPACGPSGQEESGARLAFSTSDGVFSAKPEKRFLGLLDPPSKKLTDDSADVLSWDRDGKKLAFSWGSFLAVTTGEPRARYLSDDVVSDRETSPSWSPDGRRIVYSCTKRAGSSNVCVVDVATGKESLLTDSSGFDGAPVFSPDGSKIAFVSDRADKHRYRYGKDADIYLMDADGSHQTPLTRAAGVGYDLAWFPDGRRLTFWKVVDRDIYAIDADGSEPTRLTSSNPAFVSFLTPSPDGRTLAFLSYNGYQSNELHVVDANGDSSGREKVLAKDVSGSGPPSWSPDGRKIAYLTDNDTGSDIMAAGLISGSEPEKLFTGDVYTSFPSWRPQ